MKRVIAYPNNGTMAVEEIPFTVDDLVARELEESAVANEIIAGLPAYLSEVRRRAVSQGFNHGGIRIYTDAESIATLTALRVVVKEDPNYMVKFKSNGAFYLLGSAQIINISDAARAYVQNCFEAESLVLALMNNPNSDLTTHQAVEDEFNAQLQWLL